MVAALKKTFSTLSTINLTENFPFSIFPHSAISTLPTFYAQHLPHSLFSVLLHSAFSTPHIFHTPLFSTLCVFYTPHFLHSLFSTLRNFYTPHFPHSTLSTLLIFHTPYFPHSLFSTLRTPHSTLRIIHRTVGRALHRYRGGHGIESR